MLHFVAMWRDCKKKTENRKRKENVKKNEKKNGKCTQKVVRRACNSL